MAGIGFELRKIYGRKTLASSVWGTIYATLTTIGPSVMFALLILFLRVLLLRSNLTELENMFFISSFTYIFLIAILVSAVFNTVLSRYISDCIFLKTEREISASMVGVLTLGSATTGIVMLVLCSLMSFQDAIPLSFLCVFYLLGILATNTYNLITFVSALKQYKEITLSYFAGITLSIGLYLVMEGTGVHPIMAAYAALICGFLLINIILVYLVIKAFGLPKDGYFKFLEVFRLFPSLAVSGSAYMLGFYIPTIVYWLFSNMSVQVSIFKTAPTYDLAMFMAIAVNMPAMVIFVVKVETAFYDKYVAYLSALNSGNYAVIERERINMANVIRLQLFFVYEVQLIIVVVLICLANVFFPYLSIGSNVLNLFMVLAMGIYSVFCMYFTIIFLYYFEDHTGASVALCVFAAVVLILSLVAAYLGSPYYPLPLLIGAIVGWVIAFTTLKKRLIRLNSFLMCK